MSDTGTPFVLSLPENMDIVKVYENIAKNVVLEVENV